MNPSSEQTSSIPALLVRDLAAVMQLTRDRESAQTRLERLVGREMATLLQEMEQLAEPIGRAA